jgi:hypothetical protein
VVGYQSQIVVMLSIGDLIHPYQEEVVKAPAIELFSYYLPDICDLIQTSRQANQIDI